MARTVCPIALIITPLPPYLLTTLTTEMEGWWPGQGGPAVPPTKNDNWPLYNRTGGGFKGRTRQSRHRGEQQGREKRAVRNNYNGKEDNLPHDPTY